MRAIEKIAVLEKTFGYGKLITLCLQTVSFLPEWDARTVGDL